MTREEKIEFLMENDFEYIKNNSGEELLWSYLEFGFKGYSNYTDEELNMEVKQRKEMSN